MDAEDLDYVCANPVAQLLTLIESPGRNPLKRQQVVSQFLNLLLFDGMPRQVSTEDLGRQTLGVLDAPEDGPWPGPPPGSTAPGFVRRLGLLALLGTVEAPTNRLAIALDDREEALRSEDFDLAWRRWLALANLRQALDAASTTHIQTRSSLTKWIDEHAVERDSWVDLLVHSGARWMSSPLRRPSS
jgi:hypothetical protein